LQPLAPSAIVHESPGFDGFPVQLPLSVHPAVSTHAALSCVQSTGVPEHTPFVDPVVVVEPVSSVFLPSQSLQPVTATSVGSKSTQIQDRSARISISVFHAETRVATATVTFSPAEAPALHNAGGSPALPFENIAIATKSP
jgi:hypothetical protein